MDTTELQHLKLAFVLDQIHRIVDADGVESYAEYRLEGQVFPRHLLRDAGFLAEDGTLTAHFRSMSKRAHAELPDLTDDEEKVEIFRLLFAASAIDELAQEEVAVLHRAGLALGFDEERIPMLMGALAAEE